MTDLEPILKLSKDLKNAAASLSDSEVRYLVDAYYTLQNDRIRANNQVRASKKEEEEVGVVEPEPHEILAWLADNSRQLENQVKRALAAYVDTHPMGKWLQNITGVGPVISAGLLAHIDINIADTAGKVWSYAGIAAGRLDTPWKKGEKRPWNARLKVLCWKIGESFVKVSSNEKAVYGHYYVERKQQYIKKNEEGGFKEFAARTLENKKFGKDTDAYKCYIEGKLPPAHIHAMATRAAVKLFLSHFQQVWYEKHHGKPAPKPFVIAHLNHKDFIAPPV